MKVVTKEHLFLDNIHDTNGSQFVKRIINLIESVRH